MGAHPTSVGIALAAVLGLLSGVALSRSNLCLMRAGHEVSRGHFSTFLGLIAASAVAAVVFFLSGQAGWHERAPWVWPTGLTVAGAVLFAVGARLSAACSIGVVGRLSSGDLGALATILGMVVALLALPRSTLVDAPPVWAGQIQAPMAVAMAVIAGVIGIVALRRGESGRIAAAILLGAIAALLYSFHVQVTWSELAADAVNGAGVGAIAAAGIASLLLGAFGARYLTGGIHWRLPKPAQFAREFVGGLLMGAGSLLIPGASDALAFYGMPSGSPHALVAFIVLFTTIVLSFRLFPVDYPALSEKA